AEPDDGPAWPAPAGRLVALPAQAAVAVGVLPADVRRPAADLRHHRDVPLPRGRPRGHAPIRGARGGAERRPLHHPVRVGRGAPVAASSGHARDARRRPGAVRAAARPADARHRHDGRLLDRCHAGLGADPVRRATDARPPGRLPRQPAGGRGLDRPARARAGVHVRPLPARERALEPPRVPPLAAVRGPRAARGPARLGRGARATAVADLGRRGAAAGGARREPLAAARRLPGARGGQRADRRARAAALRAPGPRPRHPGPRL
ncbi:MAG: hypothetical protein AVDCRST_MAG79-1203, partial [uncultured Thermoleophilia bacterium]